MSPRRLWFRSCYRLCRCHGQIGLKTLDFDEKFEISFSKHHGLLSDRLVVAVAIATGDYQM